jgi:nicotinamidase-related amidase
MKKALLIIDMQILPFIWKDHGGKALLDEESLLNNTEALIKRARKANIPLIYVMHSEETGSLRAEGQPLWQVHPLIAPQEGDRLVTKYFADSFYQTSLGDVLAEEGIKNVVLCGIQTEFCVDTTCRSAFGHGLGVELASDCHSTYDSDELTARQILNHHNSILAQFAAIKPAEQIEMA